MNQQLRFGFVGAGEIAVASADAVSNSSHATLARVFDVRTDLAHDLATRFGGQMAESLEELVSDSQVDAVYICVPHFLHRATAVAAAEAGKQVFIEKPMGVNPDDAQAILDACRKAGVACGVPFLVRNAPAYHHAHRLVQEGTIGDITGFRVTYRGDKPETYWMGGYSGRATSDWRQSKAKAGGGVMIMNTIHDLDAVLWITGLDVTRVQGIVANIASPGEVEDVAHAILSCEGGALGSLEAQAALPGGQGTGFRSVNRVYGRHGQIVLPSPWGKDPLLLYTRETGSWQEVVPPPMENARQVAFDDYAAAVLNGTPLPIPGEAGLKASRVLHGVYESAQSGKPVNIASSHSNE